ncbi:hypothetical protein [Planococcus beigongshangi]|uniref:hypothetical protein n=1 Tax=Planococcus beigongshangi TaxID=2782536 RepID=UPI00193C510C|nr:hypothetical protein [Planococcus beigongshangi]
MALFATAAGSAYDPKSWAAGVWTQKSDGARSALTGIRWNSRVALFATAAGSAYDPKSWAAGAWTQKSDGARSAGPPEPGHRKATAPVQLGRRSLDSEKQ